MKTVLMIAPYFTPRRRVGALRPYKFASRLPSYGWKPVVFTIATPDEELTPREKNALKGVTVKNINPPFDRTTGKKQNRSSENAESDHRVWAEWADWIAEWFDRQVPMDSWIFLFWSAYPKILEQAKEIDPDLIWSTGDPWSGHWLGQKLSADLDKPWIADFRDPWTLSGLSLRERSFLSNRADRRLERKFVRKAGKLIFTAKATEELYSEFYSLPPEKTETIYNSFDEPESYASPDEKGNWKADINSSLLNVVFFGSFRRLSPITPIAKAIAELPEDSRKHIRVHSFGRLQRKDKEILQKLGISDLFVSHEKVKPEQAPAVFKKADLLLVSTSIERESIIPAKLWEYLISDKQVLSITPSPEIGNILEETGAGVHYHNKQTSDIADFLHRSIQRKENGEPLFNNVRNADVIESYSVKNNTRKLAQIMDTLSAHEH